MRDHSLVLRLCHHLVAGGQIVQARIVVLEALEPVIGRFQRAVGNQGDTHPLAQLDLGNFWTFFVEQEGSHLDRHLRMHSGGVVLHGIFLDDAQDLQRTRLDIAHMARSTATWTGNGRALGERRAQPLTAHFQQAEFADGAELHTGAVQTQGIAQAIFHFTPVFLLVHVDEVDHDQATQIAQTHLSRHFIRRFQIGAGSGFLDVASPDGARGVHVDRHQRFRVVDHDGATAGQRDDTRVGALDLVFDLEAREQRCVVAITLDLGRVFRHHMVHELMRLLVNIVGIDQDVADFRAEIITQGSHHQVAFLVNQKSAFSSLGCAVNGLPQFEQVVKIPLQLRRVAANAGRARNDAHALRILELVHCLLELGAFISFDAAAHAATAGVVGHQHHIAARQTDESGQRRALVAALFFFHLYQQFLAFTNRVADARLAGRNTFGKVLTGNFLERQKPMPFFTVIDKTGFQ